MTRIPDATRSNPRDDLSDAVRSAGGDPIDFARRLGRLIDFDAPRFARMWSYYRNPASIRPSGDVPGASGHATRPYRQAQEWGLPRRITGGASVDPITGEPTASTRREVVIENDIAWRVDAMVDFLFGRQIRIDSVAPDPSRREALSSLGRAILASNGGSAWMQQVALIGAVFGSVDVLVKLLPEDQATPFAKPASRDDVPASHSPDVSRTDSDTGTGMSAPRSSEADADLFARLARRIRLEIVEPARALPLLDGLDRRVVRAYAQVYQVERSEPPFARRATWWRRWTASRPTAAGRSVVVELITPDEWMSFHDGRLVAAGVNSLGRIPLAHVQNIAIPFEYHGAGEVEPLMPLQDELNTRLSDRAHRITMQSFRMYLGKGIEQFTEQPVAPGRMWMTDNPDAQIVEFGGDAACPSEDAHVREVREAMDKTSGVTPIAAGILKNRIGRLTSGAALRVTLMSLIARTHRKRLSYGHGLAQVVELALAWLDRAGLFHSGPHERGIEIHWPDPVAAIAGDEPPLCRLSDEP